MKPAKKPEDLARFFVERANAGDVEGLVELYEPNAALACGNGKIAVGADQIRQFYKAFLAKRPQLRPVVQSRALRNGDIALTSSRLGNGDTTAEIARRQPKGNWLWAVDQPAVAKEV
ncbi:MAG: YybH family protein [Burkholderiales bacterium]